MVLGLDRVYPSRRYHVSLQQHAKPTISAKNPVFDRVRAIFHWRLFGGNRPKIRHPRCTNAATGIPRTRLGVEMERLAGFYRGIDAGANFIISLAGAPCCRRGLPHRGLCCPQPTHVGDLPHRFERPTPQNALHPHLEGLASC